jgi:hypothetical protein
MWPQEETASNFSLSLITLSLITLSLSSFQPFQPFSRLRTMNQDDGGYVLLSLHPCGDPPIMPATGVRGEHTFPHSHDATTPGCTKDKVPAVPPTCHLESCLSFPRRHRSEE